MRPAPSVARYQWWLLQHGPDWAWAAVTWARWKLRRGPRCGDPYCPSAKDWPGGRGMHDSPEWRPPWKPRNNRKGTK
jgi:hypothetical protein